MPTVVIKDSINPGTSSVLCNQESTCDSSHIVTGGNFAIAAKRRRTSRCNTPRMNEHAHSEKVTPSTSDSGGDFMCEWNGCGR